MALPERTIVYFHYAREGDTLTPTTGGLRDAKRAEFDHPVDHCWIEELEANELRLNIAVQGFEIRPMPVAMEHIAENREDWERLARAALAEEFPDCAFVDPPAGEEQ